VHKVHPSDVGRAWALCRPANSLRNPDPSNGCRGTLRRGAFRAESYGLISNGRLDTLARRRKLASFPTSPPPSAMRRADAATSATKKLSGFPSTRYKQALFGGAGGARTRDQRIM